MQEGPSRKAQGKRTARNSALNGNHDSLPAMSPNTASPAPEDDLEADNGKRTVSRRVQPSRARRGGFSTQVGANEIDINILDMLKRAGAYVSYYI